MKVRDPASLRIAGVALFVFALAAVQAGAASPNLHRVDPTGGQRGQQVQVVLQGARLDDAREILFYRPGIKAENLAVADDGSVKVQFTIADDCPIGEHPLRLRSATGLSQLRTFFVGALPVVPEQEPNNAFENPQKIDMNVTIQGVIDNEDVDHFAVEVRAGQRITAEIEAIRLGRTMFDPYIAILNQRRFELCTSDDSALHLQDSVASIVAPEDGTYVVQVREASYGGSGDSQYRLHIGGFERPWVAYPPGGEAGKMVSVQLLGDAAGPITRELLLPAAMHPETLPIVLSSEAGVTPSPILARAVPFANVLEEASSSESSAEPATPPIAFNGIVDPPGQQDTYRFHANKDQQFDIQVFARRLRSPLDSVLDIHGPDGNHIAGNDDNNGPDSYLRFKAPVDGVYQLRIRDHLARGGPTFVYRIEVDQVRPAISLSINLFNSRQHQYLQTVPVPRGNRYAILVRGNRVNTGGTIELEMSTMAAGVTMQAAPIDDGVQFSPVVFEATAEAPLAGGLFDLRGRIRRDHGDLLGSLEQRVPLVISNPNETIYYQTSVRKLAMAVTEPVPFKIELEQPAVPLVRNGSARLKITARRSDGFDGEIEVRMLWNPPGISSTGSIKIAKGQTEGFYPVNAAGNASIRSSSIVLTARAEIGGGELWVASNLVHLAVTEPFVGGSIQMAASERGQPALVVCRLDQYKPFDGQASIRLLGLPHQAEAAQKQISKDDDQVVFEVVTTNETPLGTHKSLFCEVVVTQNDAPIIHRIALGGVLRVDEPKPEPVKKNELKKTPPPPQPKAARPLSRLEQLRQDAADKAKANAESPRDQHEGGR